MRKLFLFLSVLITCYTKLIAQEDSLKREILRYKDPKAELIAKGRGLLLEKLKQNDEAKVQDLFTYLLGQEDSSYLAFYPTEKILLSYLTGQFRSVLANLPIEEQASQQSRYLPLMLPFSEVLFARVLEKVLAKEPVIRQAISDASLLDTDMAFLQLNLSWLLLVNRNSTGARDSLNQMATAFLQSYPASLYESYVRHNIRYQFHPSNWGLGFELFSGYTQFTGDLQRQFKSSVPIGIAFDIGYKKALLFLRNYIGFSRTLEAIPFAGGTWKKGAQARVYLPEASLGYVLLNTNLLRLVPFAGISSTDIAPTEYDKSRIPEYENVELKFTTTYTAGINADFKLGKSTAGIVSMTAEQAFWLLRVRYAFNSPEFGKKYRGFEGNLHYLTIGIGGFGRKLKRVY